MTVAPQSAGDTIVDVQQSATQNKTVNGDGDLLPKQFEYVRCRVHKNSGA